MKKTWFRSRLRPFIITTKEDRMSTRTAENRPDLLFGRRRKRRLGKKERRKRGDQASWLATARLDMSRKRPARFVFLRKANGWISP